MDRQTGFVSRETRAMFVFYFFERFQLKPDGQISFVSRETKI